MSKGKVKEYTIKHECGHTERLLLSVKIKASWLRDEAKRPCPGCVEVRR